MTNDNARLDRYAEAYDPEAFDPDKRCSNHPAAQIQWAARRKMALDAAPGATALADAEQAELRAKLVRVEEALRRVERIRPEGSTDWRESGEAMRRTVVREIRIALDGPKPLRECMPCSCGQLCTCSDGCTCSSKDGAR